MFAYLSYLWSTSPPIFFGATLCVVALAGYLLGLKGYTQASRDAYSRFVAARQRSASHTWPDSAP